MERGLTGFAQKFERWRNLSMNELRAKLHGSWGVNLVPGPDSATHAVACLQQKNRASGLGQRARRGESGHAGTNDHYVPAGLIHG